MAHLENQYGEWVLDLEPDGFGFYSLPTNNPLDNLAIGDVYTVVADENDEQEEED